MTSLDQAVVLAAGEGSRVRPLTRYQPKSMLHVGGRPILEYPLDALAGIGIEHVVLVIGHRKTRIQNHFESEYGGMEITYVTQETQLGSGHALQNTAHHVDDEFLVVNGDNVINATMVRDVARRYAESDAAACLAVVASTNAAEYGTVGIRDGLVERIDEGKNGVTSRINAGVYVFDRTIFPALERTEFENGERPLTGAIEKIDGKVVAETPNGVWLDSSFPWDLLTTNETLLHSHPELVDIDDLVDESARIHETAVVGENVRIGPDCKVSAGAVVRGGACLFSGTSVGENAVVEGSIIGPDSRVGANTVLRDSIVAGGVTIGDGTISPGRSATIVLDGTEYVDRRLGGVVADRATVGANVTIAPGCRIGPRSRVAPGVTLNGDIVEGAEVIG